MTQGLTSASRRSVNIIHLTGCEKYGLNMANNVMKLIQKTALYCQLDRVGKPCIVSG